ncbi:MAG: hypothetical protein EBT07_12685, partial [Actinobacteria bacterium]|nr:hypothetical protein [Actinomycetota bacterium]
MHHDFRSYLTELYDKPFRLVRTVEAHDHAAYHYTDGDENDSKADYLVVNFGYIQPQDEGWDMDFTRGGSTALTGGGKAAQVFATVMDGFKRFTRKYYAKTVSFTAAKSEVNAKTYSYSSGSRIKLYNSLIKRYAAQAGYRL